jgi:F0F1-type ATP synthase beta subunit
LTKGDYYEIAGIMGLRPGRFDWHETLFPHLVDLFVSFEVEGAEILKSVEGQSTIIKVMVSVMNDGLRSGQIISCFAESKNLARNMNETATRGNTRVPVGNCTLGRMVNVLWRDE